MNTATYPLAVRYEIPPRRGVFDSLKSRLSRIPVDRHDYAVVLETVDGYRLVPNGAPVASAPGVENAVAVCLVEARAFTFALEFLPLCSNHVERRPVSIEFRAKVVSPELVLGEHLYPAVPIVESWAKRLVGSLSTRFDATDWDDLSHHLTEHLTDDTLRNPPIDPAAIRLSVTDVEVGLPEGLEEHHLQMIRFERERELWEARQQREDEIRKRRSEQESEEVAVLEQLIQRGPLAIRALAATRDPEHLKELANESREERNRVVDILTKAANEGKLSDSVTWELVALAATQPAHSGREHIGLGPTGLLGQGRRRGESAPIDADSGSDREEAEVRPPASFVKPEDETLLGSGPTNGSNPNPNSDPKELRADSN